MLPTPVNGYCCQCGVPAPTEPAVGMEPARVPSNGKSWEAIDIFLFENGQEGVPPRKYHLTYQDLNAWDNTLENLSKSQSETMDIKVDLFTIQGEKILSPLELKNGSPYVAVVPPDCFIDSGYESYLVKATRSLEKRLKNTSIMRVLNEDDINSIKKCLENGCCEMIQTKSSPCPTPISVIQNRPKAQDRIPSLSDNSDLHRYNKKLAVPTKKRTTTPRYQQSITSSKRIMNSMPSIRKKSFHKKESFSKTNTKEPNQSQNRYNIRKKYAENIKRVSVNKPRRLRSSSVDQNNTQGIVPLQNVNESQLTHMNEQVEPQIINNNSFQTNVNTQDGPFRTYITDYNVLHQLILDMAHKQSKKFFLENASGTQADERVVSNIDQLRDLLEYITTADQNYQKIIIEDKIDPKTDNTIITNVDELKSLLDVMNTANIVLKSDKKMILDRNLKIRTKDKVVTNIDQLHDLVTDSNETTTTSKALTVKRPSKNKTNYKKNVPLKINKTSLSESPKKSASYKDEEIQIVVIQSDKNVGSLETPKCDTDCKTTQEPSKTSVKPSNIDQYVAVINPGDGNAKLSIDLQQAEGGIKSFISSLQTGNVIKINSGSQVLPFNEITSIDEAMLATFMKDAKIDKNNTKLIVVKCICCDKLKIIENANTLNPEQEANEEKPTKASVVNEETMNAEMINKRISIPPAKNFLTVTETEKLTYLQSSKIKSNNIEDGQTLEINQNLNTMQITKSASLPKTVSDASNTIGAVTNYGQSSNAYTEDLSSTYENTKSSYRQSLSHNADEGISTNIGKIANDTLDLILNENENVFTDIEKIANEPQRFSLYEKMPTENGAFYTQRPTIVINENESSSNYIDGLSNASQRLSINPNKEILIETGGNQTDRLSLNLNENERTPTDIGEKPNANQRLSLNANQEIIFETGGMQNDELSLILNENELISTDFNGKPKNTQRLSVNKNLEVTTETSGMQTDELSSTLNKNEIISTDINKNLNTGKISSQIANVTTDNRQKSTDRQSLSLIANEYTPVDNGESDYDKIVDNRLNTSANVSEAEKYISQCKYEQKVIDDNQTKNTTPGISRLLKEISLMNEYKPNNSRRCTLEKCGYGADSHTSQPNTNMSSAEKYDDVKSQAKGASTTNYRNYEMNSSFNGVHSRNAENTTSPMQTDQDKINGSKTSEVVSTKYVSGRSVSIDDKTTAHIPITCTSSEYEYKGSCCGNVNNPNINQESIPEMPSVTKYSDNNQLKNEVMNGTQNTFDLPPISQKKPSSPKIKLLDNRDSTIKSSATSQTSNQKPTHLRNTQSATTTNNITENGATSSALSKDNIFVSIAPLETTNIKKNEHIEKRVSQSAKKISISNSTNSISKSGRKYNVPTNFEPTKQSEANSIPSELDTFQKSGIRPGSVRVIKANSITPRTSKSSDYTGPSILELMQKQKESDKSSCASDKMSYSPNYLVDKYTQTESLDLLLVARRHEDSHYSFHFPTLEDLKQYQLL